MRLFVALELPDEIKAELSSLTQKLKSVDMDAKWVKPENIHITLKFLGEVPDIEVAGVRKGVKEAVLGKKPFEVSLEGAGAFGRPPRVLWVDLGKGKKKVVELIKDLNSSLDHIRKEAREPSPHITLARIRFCRDIQGLNLAVESMKEGGFGGFEVESIELKKSVLTPKGPLYSTVETFPLG